MTRNSLGRFVANISNTALNLIQGSPEESNLDTNVTTEETIQEQGPTKEMETGNRMQREPDVPRPTIYDGSTDATRFVRKFRSYIHLCAINETRAIEMLPLILSGKAEEDYMDKWEESPETLQEGLNSIVEAYRARSHVTDDWGRLSQIQQRNGEDINEYADRFRQAKNLIMGSIPDTALMHYFVHGLKIATLTEVRRQHPKTYAEATQLAGQIENDNAYIEQCQKERSGKETTTKIQTAAEVAPPFVRNPNWNASGRNRIVSPYMKGIPPPRSQMGGAPLPRIPMGGAQNARFPLGGAIQSRPPAETNDKLEKLRQQFQKLRIGSAEREEWYEWIRQTGRCWKCMEIGHVGRNCPKNGGQVNMIQEEEDMEEQDPEWAQ